MQTIFPTATGFQGMFLVGYRKHLGQIERTGTVVLKRAYTVVPSANDPADGHLVPAAALPVFVQDQPGNLVANGDFAQGSSSWQAGAGVNMDPAADPDDASNPVLQVSGAASGAVQQTVTFPLPVAGRRFGFSLRARADAATTANNVTLLVGGTAICLLNLNLTTVWQTFSATGSWPAATPGSQMAVVLRMATDASRTVLYDDVAVHGLHYEHDMAAFKPEGDATVIGFSGSAGQARLQIAGQDWLQRDLAASQRPDLFGWQLRDESPRKQEWDLPAGNPTYPLPEPLPAGFDNRYYNGYLRSARQPAALPYLAAVAPVRIEHDGTRYNFTLGSETVRARYDYYPGRGPDDDCAWRRRTVPMLADTLVVEPGSNRCYVVWRGTWPLDERPEGLPAYRRLVVTAD